MSEYIGEKVKEAGGYVYDHLIFFSDRERSHRLNNFYDAFLIQYKLEDLTNRDLLKRGSFKTNIDRILVNLKVDESFSWPIYGRFESEHGDTLSKLELSLPDVNWIKLETKLTSGTEFAVLITVTKTQELDDYIRGYTNEISQEEYEKILRKVIPNLNLLIRGRASRKVN